MVLKIRRRIAAELSAIAVSDQLSAFSKTGLADR
jgi:hypothetical protein